MLIVSNDVGTSSSSSSYSPPSPSDSPSPSFGPPTTQASQGLEAALEEGSVRDAATARAALKLIKVDYEVLPHVTDVDEAMKPTAPVSRRISLKSAMNS